MKKSRNSKTYVGIKRDTIYKWINEKKMPAHRMGRLWKFKKEDIAVCLWVGGTDIRKERVTLKWLRPDIICPLRQGGFSSMSL